MVPYFSRICVFRTQISANCSKSGVQILAPDGWSTFVCSFSIHFQILHTKLDIVVFNYCTNQIKYVENFVFLLISDLTNKILIDGLHNNIQFCLEDFKMKRKKDNIFWTFQVRDLNPGFLNNLQKFVF